MMWKPEDGTVDLSCSGDVDPRQLDNDFPPGELDAPEPLTIEMLAQRRREWLALQSPREWSDIPE